MNIEEMIWNGASEEEIAAAMAKIKAEKVKQEAALRAQKENEDKEALKAEGRAYVINAIIAYSKAFDLDDEDWDQEAVDQLEALLIKIEDMIPMYKEIMEKQNELNDLGFGFGLGGFKM
jgi:type III secretion system FlhB-like substrate exporter